MKIGTITFHGALNFGSALQSYALQEVLKGMGHEVRIIDYRSRDYEQYRFFQPRHPKMTLRAMRCWRKQSSRRLHSRNFLKSISGLQRDRISGKKKVICTNSLSSLIVLFAEAIKFGISIAHKVLLAPISFHLPEIVDELLTLPVLLTLSSRPENFDEQLVSDLLSRFDFLSVREEETVPLFQPLVDTPIDVVLIHTFVGIR